MTVPAVEGLLGAPYVTVPEFRASPTWLDSNDLVPGGNTAAQDAELTNVLLRASQWVDNRAGQRLGAHTAVEQLRVRLHRGRLIVHPSNTPVREVTEVAYGPDPGSVAPLADLGAVWVEDGRQIVTHLGGPGGVRLEFGSASPGGEVYVRIGYVAGYTATTLAAAAAQAATQITVADPTGIYPGDVLRIWDPAREEAVTVASGYVPGTPVVPLAGALSHDHDTGAGVSGLPADVHQAVICCAVALLLREDAAAADGVFGDADVGPVARSEAGSQAGDLIGQAARLIAPYRRVR